MPSFAIGILVGAMVVVMFEFLPALLAPPPPAPVAEQTGTPADSGVQYQFQSLLTAAPTPVVTPEETPVPIDGVVPPPSTEGLVPGMTVSTDVTATMSAVVPTGVQSAVSAGAPVVAGLAAPGQGGAAAAAATAVDLSALPTAVEDAAPVTGPDVADTDMTSAELLLEDEADQPPATDTESAPQSGGSLQAASFQSRADAERLRAELLLLDLPADTSEFKVSGSSWYRVTVGPFADAAAAEEARERLRARNLTAIPYNR